MAVRIFLYMNPVRIPERSLVLLQKLGAKYVLVGHSERRTYHHESDELCAAKVQAAYTYDLTPVCALVKPWKSVRLAPMWTLPLSSFAVLLQA